MNDSKEKILIDKGWNEMSTLLDREMPLDKSVKSNSSTVFALLLLLLFLGIGGGYYMTINNKAHLKKDTIEKKKSISNKNNFADIVASSSNYPVGKKNSINKNNNNTIDQKALDKSKKNQDDSKGLENKIQLIVSTGIYDNALIGSFTKMKSMAKYENAMPIDKLDEKQLTINKIDNIAMEVSGEDFTLLYTKKITPVYLHFKNKKHFSKTFSLGSAIVSENLTSFGGMESGVEFELGLTNKIGLTTGVDFSFFKKKGMHNSFLTNIFSVKPYDGRYEDDKVSERDLFSTRYKEQFNIATRNPYTLSGFVDELYYVGLPVSIYYKAKNLRFSIGFKTSFLIYGTNFTSNKNFVGGQNYIISSNRAFINSKVYNRFDYSSFVAFDWRVYKNFSLSTKFSCSFVHILSDPEMQLKNISRSLFTFRTVDQYKDRYDNNIYFSLGIKYKL